MSGAGLRRQRGERPGGVWRRLLPAAVACCVIGAMCAKEATAVDYIDAWQLKPVYKSKYLNTRLKEDWEQGLHLTRATDDSDLVSDFTTKNSKSSRQNEDKGSFTLMLERGSFFGDFKLDTSLTRKKTYKEGYLRIENEDNFGLGIIRNYGKPEATSLKLDMLALYLRGEETEERSRVSNFTSDNTKSNGFGGRVWVDGDWNVTSATSFSTRIEQEMSTEDSRTVSFESSSSGTEQDVQKNTDRNRSTKLELEGGWEEFELLMLGVKGTYQGSTNQFFYPQADGQETKEMLRASASVFVGGQIGENLGYEVDFSSSENTNDYKLKETSDQEESTSSTDLSAFYISSLPLIRGTRFDGGYSSSTTRRDRRNLNQDVSQQRLAGTATRQLNEFLKVTLQANESLTQDMNDDMVNDKDTHITTYSLTGRYDQRGVFTATGYYKVDSKELVFTSDDKANSSYQRDDYIVRADYTWTRANQMKISQNLSVNSTYDVYTLDETRNTLNRRNKLTTRLVTPLMPKTTIMFEHRFERSDNGSYSRSETDDSRKYRLSSRTLIQGLTSSVVHQLNSFLGFTLTEQYDVTRKHVEATGATERRDVIWVSGQINVTRRLIEDILLTGTIEKKKGSKETYDYWMVKADVTKTF